MGASCVIKARLMPVGRPPRAGGMRNSEGSEKKTRSLIKPDWVWLRLTESIAGCGVRNSECGIRSVDCDGVSEKKSAKFD
jgi:hypothetical protein